MAAAASSATARLDVAYDLAREHWLQEWGHVAVGRDAARDGRKLPRQVIGGNDRVDAASGKHSALVDLAYPRMRMRAAHDKGFGHEWDAQVGDVTCFAAEKAFILHACDARTDHGSEAVT
jgi:hypothetical protein